MNTLISEAKKGDYEALGKLYEACRKKGLSIASRYVKNDSDSEDMYQDAFLKAMENIDRFDETRDFQSWLDTIIANTCKDFLRKKRPINFTDMSDEENEFVDTISGSDEGSLPESSYLRAEMLKIVDDIVDTLPAEQKQATLLFYFKDYSVKQVASLQHVSEDTVKSRLNYSRKKMALATADYEKKHGIRVSFACVVPAVMLLYFKNSAYAARLEGELAALSAAGSAGAAAIASEAGSGLAKAGAVAAKAGVVAAKTGFSAKIAGFIVVGALALTGAGFGIHHLINADAPAVGSSDNQIVSVQAEPGSGISGNVKETSDDNKETASVELTEEEKRAAALKEAIKAAKVGDFIEIGTFEQDGDTANGAEPIEWMVLADENGKKLLLSKYILMPVGNLMEFPGDGVNYTWKECGIREYLNGDFYESAFTEEERAQITETEIRSTWEDYSSLGELLDVETISWEFVGQTFSRDIGKIVTTDRIFIPDFDEDFVRYMKVHKDIYENFGTDMLAKATPASGIENFSYTQQAYDWEKDYTGYLDYNPEDVNLDESLIGEEFGNYILRTGMSGPCPTYSEDGSSTGNHVISACYYVVTGSDAAVYYPPYWITEFPFHTKTLGIRPMMWVTTESGETQQSSQSPSKKQSENGFVAAEADDVAKSDATSDAVAVADAEVGDLIKFGRYEQDKKTANGTEDIEWLVLEKEDDRMLIISRYALDWQKYDAKLRDITWEDSTLRNWLNDSFYNTAFTGEEQEKIVPVTNENPDSNAFFNTDYSLELENISGYSEAIIRGWGAMGGNATNDKVFCLSYEEALSYFPSDEARKCVPTKYAMSQGVCHDISAGKAEDGTGMCGWWLRSPGKGQTMAMVVQSGGYIRGRSQVNSGIYGVRPALWLSIK